MAWMCAESLDRGEFALSYKLFFTDDNGLFYTRYMDNFLFLTPKRWPLRRAIKYLYGFFELGGFERHSDKARIGKIEHGFDWLGVWFTPTKTTIVPRALANHTERFRQVYHCAILIGLSHNAASIYVCEYKQRWAANMLPTTQG
ncbi:hypothetical protein H8I91_19495 [Serratia fonticola]|uniref:hypothetical protein n=1 Tax=Serratia fonticola TaxID=47917 RepID=UPI001644EE37|nr:hypothetical protein [Serratia fonticola]MBC3252452.1 hypothetical protein [Serratia fonticola]